MSAVLPLSKHGKSLLKDDNTHVLMGDISIIDVTVRMRALSQSHIALHDNTAFGSLSFTAVCWATKALTMKFYQSELSRKGHPLIIVSTIL